MEVRTVLDNHAPGTPLLLLTYGIKILAIGVARETPPAGLELPRAMMYVFVRAKPETSQRDLEGLATLVCFRHCD